MHQNQSKINKYMKVSILKISRNKEVINRLEVAELAEMIRNNPDEDKVFKLRLNYQFMQPQRLNDGQIIIDNEQHRSSRDFLCHSELNFV